MTMLDLRTAIKAWITQIIVTEGGEVNFPIIGSHTNGPEPSTAYIQMSYAGGFGIQGRASRGDVQIDGTTLLVSDWAGTIELREVNGEGDRLRELVKSLDRIDILDQFFRAKGLVHYTSGEVIPVPSLTNDLWHRESMVEITLALAEGVRDNTSNIDTVEYQGTIGGTE